MNTKNRLVAFGCSYTYGEGLPDCLDTFNNPNTPMPQPSQLSWASVLAEKLNLECLNKAVCGASNKEIQHTILGEKLHKDDTVVILWTHNDRSCILKPDGNPDQFIPSYTEKRRGNPPGRRDLNKLYYYYFWDEYNTKCETFVAIDHTYRYLTGLGIKVYNFTLRREKNKISSELKNLPTWFSVPLTNFSVIDDIAPDGTHPGIAASADMAEQAYAIIKE